MTWDTLKKKRKQKRIAEDELLTESAGVTKDVCRKMKNYRSTPNLCASPYTHKSMLKYTSENTNRA